MRFLRRSSSLKRVLRKAAKVRLVTSISIYEKHDCASQTNPAEMRSSRNELRSDCKHHWPRYDCAKSRYATFSVCMISFLSETIAATRGFVDLCTWDPLRRFKTVKNISSLRLSSHIALISLTTLPASHREQVPSLAPLLLACLDSSVPAPAHASRPIK